MFKIEKCSKIFTIHNNRIEAIKLSSFIISKGINIIVGKSGSGKTTLLNMLAGLEEPTQGSILYNGKNIYSDTNYTINLRKNSFGFIFQSFNLISELSVRDNIILPLKIAKKQFREKDLYQLCHLLGIDNKLERLPETLSGGEQQRVAIARAVIKCPDVIFADEPTGNLDKTNSILVMDLLVKLCRQTKASLIMVTHDVDLLEYADNVLVMEDGVIRNEISKV